ncbi:uncharacterized protein LOC110440553 [Mizuhopecten yessoensis]|uniref:Uncharacterized protein n=1 Tax=Mizuhopecten yessoensis TaxID=6573 RepID=A0A210PKV4_MIZYE|nr:uncharacterized protein LOC110440553 [Mizuhopecten yessoensis]OWF37115.1 hypothetical protein KP79_PYT09805 [Mizuhopecten yessoensis]
MWKKIRESTSGINLNFISSLMRKRRYAKFETDEDASKPLNGHLHDGRERDSGHLKLDRRDEENNKVSWTSSSCSKRRADETADHVIVDTGYHRAELKCSDNNGNRNSRRPFNPRLSEPFMADYRSTNIHDDSIDSSHGYGSDTSDNDAITHHEFYEARKNGIKTPSSLKDDVSDFVHSLVQKRYQKLDDSADESDDVDFDRRVSESDGNRRRSVRSGSHDSDNQVFHSITDITPNWEDKPKKSKKRRKTAKRARRAVRFAWKWTKRGFMGYAGNIASASSFLVVSRSGPYTRRKYTNRKYK